MSLLRIPEVAERLAVSTPRAYALAREGVIPIVRLGRQVRVDDRQLEEWIASGGGRHAIESKPDGRED